ncbi:MAG: fumarate hydratase [Candidatus Omnitrophota bacterium]
MTRTVDNRLIFETVKRLCLKANIELREDVLSALKAARRKETGARAKEILGIIIENASIAKEKKLPICQDTGMTAVYLDIGQSVIVKGDLRKAIEKGVAQAYKEGYFRKSVVADPLIRKNTNTNLPAIIHMESVPGRRIRLRVMIKGFGCENTSKTRMFRPTEGISKIEDFVVESVREAGSRPCPPVYIGIGIGGTLDKAVSMSKEAIFRPIGKNSGKPHVKKMEKALLEKINRLNIGPAGVKGGITALGVSILTYPTHIAGLPVAVNISCHATRTAEKTI